MSPRLDVRRVFNEIIQTYREQLAVLLWAALPIFVPSAILNGAIYSGSTSSGALVLLVSLILVVASFWYQAVVVEAVRRLRERGGPLSIGDLYRSVGRFVAPLFGAGILAGLAIAIGLLLLLIPGLILLTWWALLAPAIVIEHTPVFAAFRRSRELVRGSGWQVFAVIAGLWLFNLVLALVLRLLAAGISHSLFTYSVASLIAQLVVAPLAGLAAATMFFDLRGLSPSGVPLGGGAGPSDSQAVSPIDGEPPLGQSEPPPGSPPGPSEPPPQALPAASVPPPVG